MKQRILITGGSGLLALNWALTMRDRFSITLGLHKRNVVIPGIQTQPIDLESIDSLVCLLEKADPYAVIHAAGLTSVERCEFDLDYAQHANVTLASNVAKACAVTGVKLVHVSTDHLFSGQNTLVDENHPISPVNTYGKTKAKAESQVLESNPQSLVIRTNFYGWGTSYRRSFSDVVIDALKGDKEVTLFQDVFYTPILVETAAWAVHELIDLKVSGIVNVVGDERVSKYDFGLKIAEEFGLDPRGVRSGFISNHLTVARRPHDMSLSNQKVCGLLGRRLGGIQEHLVQLRQQELNGLAKEIGKL
jgi:dTDP-4-dehydrorhamnose reductase